MDRCRRLAADVLGAAAPERVVFAFNGTDALNLAILGICRPGDHVVTSVLEHNSVLRPLRYLSDQRQVHVSYVSPESDGRISPVRIREALRPETRLVALTHASNVTGTIQPIEDVAEVLRDSNALYLVDAAQTAGHLKLNATFAGIDLLACSGHKGLGGPLGTGLLYIRPRLEEELVPLRFGGTGSHSEQDIQPAELPDRYESGNHNTPGIVGLEAALEHVAAQNFADVRGHELQLTGRLIEELRSISGVTVHVNAGIEQQLGVVSISVPGFEPQVLAALLDQEFGVQTRAGLHCARWPISGWEPWKPAAPCDSASDTPRRKTRSRPPPPRCGQSSAANQRGEIVLVSRDAKSSERSAPRHAERVSGRRTIRGIGSLTPITWPCRDRSVSKSCCRKAQCFAGGRPAM